MERSRSARLQLRAGRGVSLFPYFSLANNWKRILRNLEKERARERESERENNWFTSFRSLALPLIRESERISRVCAPHTCSDDLPIPLRDVKRGDVHLRESSYRVLHAPKSVHSVATEVTLLGERAVCSKSDSESIALGRRSQQGLLLQSGRDSVSKFEKQKFTVRRSSGRSRGLIRGSVVLIRARDSARCSVSRA
jgi:hypothetical protein